jgi:hypothetical protein
MGVWSDGVPVKELKVTNKPLGIGILTPQLTT